MNEVLLLALIPAFVFLAIALYLWRKAQKPRRLSAKSLMREGESWMGRHLKDHQPRTTIHSIINRVLLKPVQPVFLRLLILREEFADVSFYQGVIDWTKMRTKARKVIIRAGQNLWPDIKFKVNYAAAKLLGFLRGIYWFYDGRISPGSQAAFLVSLIKDEKPELGIWIDWERVYGGAFEGLKNVVAMMQEIERLLPGVEVGLYTGYYFFIENSNPIWNAAQYAYLATKKLWLAFYATLEKVLIPSIWKGVMTYWQKGTPPDGLEWGVESKEIDKNEDMSGDPDPTPIPDEDDMTITYTGKVKDTSSVSPHVRATPSTTAALVRDLAPGTAFEAQGQLVTGGLYQWLNLVTPVAGWLAITSNIEYQAVTPVDRYRFIQNIHTVIVDPSGRRYEKTVDIDEYIDAVP